MHLSLGMAGANDPIEMEHTISNIKITIGGVINEPRDSTMPTFMACLLILNSVTLCWKSLSYLTEALECLNGILRPLMS